MSKNKSEITARCLVELFRGNEPTVDQMIGLLGLNGRYRRTVRDALDLLVRLDCAEETEPGRFRYKNDDPDVLSQNDLHEYELKCGRAGKFINARRQIVPATHESADGSMVAFVRVSPPIDYRRGAVTYSVWRVADGSVVMADTYDYWSPEEWIRVARVVVKCVRNLLGSGARRVWPHYRKA